MKHPDHISRSKERNSTRLFQQVFGLTLAVLLLAGCGGAPTTSATTVGAATHQLSAEGGLIPLESPLLAVELEDGTSATAIASAALLEDVGLGLDVLNASDERVTWGGKFLILEDSDPDRVVLEETSTGDWVALSVER